MRSDDELTFREAMRRGIRDAMFADPSVVCIGLGSTDPGRVFGTTANLLEEFGPNRVFDGPTSENAITGVGVGAALAGLRPVMSHQRLDFFLLAMDQLVNSAAKWRFMFGGQVSVPLTIRLIVGRGWGQGPTHSQNLQSWFAHIPGLKVVAPVFPSDAYGLIRASIEDANPVVIIEHRWLHNVTAPLAIDEVSCGLSRARIIRSGSDVTICASGITVIEALRAAEVLETLGISCEIVDLRSLNPIDWPTIIQSVSKTGRLIVADAASITGSISAEVVARISTDCFSRLKVAPIRVAHPDFPEPTSFALTRDYHVGAHRIAEAVHRSLEISFDSEQFSALRHFPHDVPGDWFTGPF